MTIEDFFKYLSPCMIDEDIKKVLEDIKHEQQNRDRQSTTK
jgi:hypothetical protein